jgi:sterol desaturase/sphingolipid hydroxylase (fatty acid hydroxylase superfamily)
LRTRKAIVFKYLQPATLIAVVALWSVIPDPLASQSWVPTLFSIGTLVFVQLLEFVNERHAGWRMNRLEFLTDLFYTVLYFAVIASVVTALVDDPLAAAKKALGISTPWTLHMPFAAQAAFGFFVVEFGQYWLHRLMHNSGLWWTHAPHHHLTQLNAAKGLVGNPVELFLVSLSVIALFDLPLKAVFCSLSLVGAVSAFAHANIRFDPPRWYAYVFTTIEAHSLHHTVGYTETRCNYANSLLLLDHLLGTFRAGESAVVGQDERQRLSIQEQLLFPLRPLLQWRSRAGVA